MADEVLHFLETHDRPYCFLCLRQAFPQATVLELRHLLELERRYGAPILIGDGRCVVCEKFTEVVAYIPGDPNLSRLGGD
jgi:hypothetical protein